jgi:hypothetical protein
VWREDVVQPATKRRGDEAEDGPKNWNENEHKHERRVPNWMTRRIHSMIHHDRLFDPHNDQKLDYRHEQEHDPVEYADHLGRLENVERFDFMHRAPSPLFH